MTKLSFGTDPTGATANDSAFAAALDYAYDANNRPIEFQSGTFRFSGKQTIAQGVGIYGEGSQGSTEGYGTTFKHYSTGDLIEFDGTGAPNTGTGGGLRDLLIVKADTYQGGTAITLAATDDDQRPGEMILSNILVAGVGNASGGDGDGGLWEHGLVIDGTACDTAGARGVRSVYGFKLRFAEATIEGETVVINQATHLFFFGLQIDQGDSDATQGLTIKGINENINLLGVDIGGTITIVANDTDNATTDLVISGKVGSTFTNNDTLCTGIVDLSMPTTGGLVLVNKSPLLSMRTNLNPRFQLTRSSATSNDKTGDGTVYTVVFNAESYDRGNNFASGDNNTYTCLCAGPHRFNAIILLTNLGSGHNRADISIVRTGSATTAISRVVPLSNAAGGYQALEISGELILAYNDQVQIQVAVSGSTKTVGVFGDGTTTYTLFEGEYAG